MGIKVGLVGLPNAGKSTIYNLLCNLKVPTANYPFTTIDPHRGTVFVKDERLLKLSEKLKINNLVFPYIEVYDIAGLVKDASKGEGLGNQFLSEIRMVDVIAHVVRCFPDSNVPHVYDSIDPVRDIELVNTELILKDLDTVLKRLEKTTQLVRVGDKKKKKELEILTKLKSLLGAGKLVFNASLNKEELEFAKRVLFLLTAKKMLYVANISEFQNQESLKLASMVKEYAKEQGSDAIIVAAKLEEELNEFEDEEEKKLMLSELNIPESSLTNLVKKSYSLLDLITFFTYTGGKEIRGWNLKKGSTVFEASGLIHKDIQKGFIKAEVINFNEFMKFKSESEAKSHGAVRIEGRDYVVEDGDIIKIHFN